MYNNINTIQFVEQNFNSTPQFGNVANCVISHNGDGIDQIILKITLPELPANIRYKLDCVYDLIKSIKVNIFGTTLFKYKSKQLKTIDMLTDKYYGETIEFSSLVNNTICYPINLNKIFGNSTTNYAYNTFDLQFNGIRMCDFDNGNLHLIVKFSDIFSTIESGPEIESKYNDIMNLQMVECSALVKYIIADSPLLIPPANANQMIKQKLTLWDSCPLKYKSDSPIKSRNHLLNFNSSNVNYNFNLKKLIIRVNNGSNNLLTSFSLQINGQECFDQSNSNMLTKIYQYNNNVCLDNCTYAVDLNINKLSHNDSIMLSLRFNNNISEYDMDVLIQTESYGTYKNRMFGKACLN